MEPHACDRLGMMLELVRNERILQRLIQVHVNSDSRSDP